MRSLLAISHPEYGQSKVYLVSFTTLVETVENYSEGAKVNNNSLQLNPLILLPAVDHLTSRNEMDLFSLGLF